MIVEEAFLSQDAAGSLLTAGRRLLGWPLINRALQGLPGGFPAAPSATHVAALP